MSDFLSGFDRDEYSENRHKKQAYKKRENEERVLPTQTSKPAAAVASRGQRHQERAAKRADADEEIEFDPGYRKKMWRRRGLIGGVLLILTGLIFLAFYQMNHLKLADLQGKELAEARSWLTENGLKLQLEQVYSSEVPTNQVMTQSPGKGTVKKGSTVQLTASKGPDPDEILPLPDLLSMSQTEAQEWKEAHQAENLTLIEEYHAAEAAGKALRVEFNNKEITNETYCRKEKVKVYYSKGPETFEKNIELPDFVNKLKAEVESWASKNSIKAHYEEQTSNDVEAGNIIAQGVAKGEKVAKQDEITFIVSLGKGLPVPNFGDYSPETAANASNGLTVQVKSQFDENVPYGQLISQSVPAGTALTAKDQQTIQVIYSAGRPYLKDLRGNLTEGDLPKYFYEEYQAKGADIRYQVRYVNSAETKGLVVGMSLLNQYLPLSATITIDISLGNLSGEKQYSGQTDTNGTSDTGTGNSEEAPPAE